MKKVENSVKKLNGKKLSTVIKKCKINISEFLNDDSEEMSIFIYEKLKNVKVEIYTLDEAYNYDFIIVVNNYEYYGNYDI